MANLREQISGKNCFKPFVIPEWHTGGAEYTLRGVSPDELIALQKMTEDKGDAILSGCKMFSVLFGNSIGERVYDDSDKDIEEIRTKIPILVIGRVVAAGFEFANEAIKKN